MIPEIACTECGGALGQNSSFGKCASCLLQDALDMDAAPSTTGAAWDFDLGPEIGRGAMGIVYEARQLSLKRPVALKMLSPLAGAVPGMVERLKLEAETAASLNHPHIVSIYTIGERDGLPFFAMELIEGAPLDKLIAENKGKLPTTDACRQAAELIAKIAEAVDYAHRHGVLHRDLKPSNVLIDLRGEPHLTDFGLSKMFGRSSALSSPGMVIGTPAYISPEAAAGKIKDVSTASDIYSLGAMLYEMLTGRPPFYANTPLETIRQVIQSEPSSPRSINPSIETNLAIICLKCLDKDPRKRYTSAKALSEDLQHYLNGEPINAKPASLVEKVSRFCIRQPVLASLILLLFLSLSTAVLFATIAYQSAQRRLQDSETLRQRQFTALLNRIEKDWTGSDRELIHLNPQELAAVSGNRRPFEGNEVPVVLGVYVSDYSRRPNRMIGMYAPLISFLQTTLTNPPVLFELAIYKDYNQALEALRGGEIDLMHLNAASYVTLREELNLEILAKDTYHGANFTAGAIFVREDSNIKSIQQLHGKSLALPLDDAFVSPRVAEAELVMAGLKATNFSSVTYLKTAEIISEIRSQIIDAGVSELRTVQQLISAGASLIILQQFDNPGNVWIATTGLHASVRIPLAKAFATLADTNILAGLDPGLARFSPATPAEYDPVARHLDNASNFPRSLTFDDTSLKLNNKMNTTSSGLKYKVINKGNGTVSPKATDTVKVHYHGTLLNGTVFDSSVERGQPISFPLNRVISGWTEGLQLMKVGDKFKFEIPPNLAYGDRSPAASIPPNSTLVFEVELLAIE